LGCLTICLPDFGVRLDVAFQVVWFLAGDGLTDPQNKPLVASVQMEQIAPSYMIIRFLFLLLAVALPLQAQNGDGKDRSGEKQVDPIPANQIPPAPVLSGVDALKSFKLAPGFKIELVAAEPLVQEPVAMVFDPEGRMWVVEMTGYMPNADGIGEDKPVGKVVILEDTDGDGKMDKRTVFAEGLVMPRAISLVHGAALVAEPPHLWLFRDTNGDGKADDKIEVAKDYGNTNSPEHTANGLIWGMDNWIYSADHTTRFRAMPEDDFKKEATAFRGQWGISQDDFGRLIYNSNSDQFRMDLVPSHYLKRNPNYRTPAGLNVDPIHNQATYPVRMTPGVNRGYRPGVLRTNGTLTAFTAACAPLIYRGENFPSEFQGNAFVCEPSANLVKRNVLVDTNGTVSGFQAYTNAEFLASTDEWFRPVNLNNGPDGALYVLDMHHGVLQHRIFLTSYLRKQSEMRGLDKTVGLGRIYRVVYEKNPVPKKAKLPRESLELVKEISSPNGWRRDTAQRLLVERDDAKVIPDLREAAVKAPTPQSRAQALWTLEGMTGGLNEATLLKAMSDRNPKVKAAAIRLSEPFLKTPSKGKILPVLNRLANDTNGDVRLQLAFTLGELEDRTAGYSMQLIAMNSARNLYVRDALLTGLWKRELEFLEDMFKQEKIWGNKRPGAEELLGSLAQCILTERKTNRIDRLLTLTASANDWQRAALLEGLVGKGAPKFKVVHFAEEPAGLMELKKKEDKQTTSAVLKLEKLITWPGQPGYVAPPVLKPFTSEQKKRYEEGGALFATSCSACHQSTGLGMEGLAPPLADSEWVLGPENRIVRVVLHGVKGPIQVNGKKFDLEMPSLGTLSDEQLASILTYVRREWENTGDPVEPATVRSIRQETAKRNEAWTAAELLKVK
jgi:glucose/arabinose dehydrogenase/mono/diheme cytochrome c family protein